MSVFLYSAAKTRTTPSAWTIYLGRQTQSGDNPNEEVRSVSQVIVHPNYNDTLYNNDIALMKLSRAVTYNDFIRPVCLAGNASLFNNATACWASGWGDINSSGECLSIEGNAIIKVQAFQRTCCQWMEQYAPPNPPKKPKK